MFYGFLKSYYIDIRPNYVKKDAKELSEKIVSMYVDHTLKIHTKSLEFTTLIFT